MEKVVTAGQIPEKYEAAKIKTLMRRIEYAINAVIQGQNHVVVTTDVSYRATSGDRVILANSSVSVVTVTLPPPSDAMFKHFDVKKIDGTANVVLIVPESGTIDGASAETLSVQYQSAQIACDGIGYWLI